LPALLGAECRDAVPVAAGGSTWQAHWVTPEERQQRHGSGLAGTIETAGQITVVSLVRGPWEFRLVRVDGLAAGLDPAGLRLRIGGWAISGDTTVGSVDRTSAEVSDGTRFSRLAAVADDAAVPSEAVAGWTNRTDASPLGPVAAVPYLELPVVPGQWTAVLGELSAAGAAAMTCPAAELSCGDGALTATLRWPDGAATKSRLTRPPDSLPVVNSGPATDPMQV